MNHALRFADRGAGHVHRWRPECACGWKGIPLRHRSGGENQYRTHLELVERGSTFGRSRRRRMRFPRRREPTPINLLPEQLRPQCGPVHVPEQELP